MAVFRVARTRDYTVMSNHHLKNKTLSLKAKGLLSQMLSLPDNWDYTLTGLSHINRESKDAIRNAVRELEQAGYIRRRQTVDSKGKFSANEYIIYEQPPPVSDFPVSENPTPENSLLENPSSENPTQLNIDTTSIQKQNTDSSKINSFLSDTTAKRPSEAKRNDIKKRDMEIYRSVIQRNIGYDTLLQDMPYDQDRIDEIVELMVETVCTSRKTLRVAGSDYPAETVKSRMLKIDDEHIRFVFGCLKENTTKIRNIKQYLLTTLFNAPTTIGNYYSALVNHNLYGDSEKD